MRLLQVHTQIMSLIGQAVVPMPGSWWWGVGRGGGGGGGGSGSGSCPQTKKWHL